MTNQAAQTMPELPEPYKQGRKEIPGTRDVDCGAGPDLYTADQMLAMYQQGYAAALSQTAGVAEGWRTEIESILSDAARGGPPVGRDWCCLSCGKWTPINHPEAHAHEDDCAAMAEWDARLKWKSRLHAMLAAAPAASGGEAREIIPVGPDDGWCRRCGCGNDTANFAHLKSCTNAPNPPSAASVSERARDMVTALYGDKAVFTRHDVARAIEQALTQQRGEAAAWLIRDERGRVVDAVESEAQRDRLLNTGYGQLPQWTAEPLYAGSAPLALAGTSWTHEDLKDLRERLVSAGISAHLNGDSNKASDRQFIRQAVTEAYGLIDDLLTTTPQPSADAVRELVRRWRDEANAGYLTGDALIDCATTNRQSVFFQCANELESLLSGGSHA